MSVPGACAAVYDVTTFIPFVIVSVRASCSVPLAFEIMYNRKERLDPSPCSL